MRILITGNMGYVDQSSLGSYATIKDVELIGFDTAYFGHSLTGVGLLPEALLAGRPSATFGFPDLLDGVDAVVHLSAVSNDPMGRNSRPS